MTAEAPRLRARARIATRVGSCDHLALTTLWPVACSVVELRMLQAHCAPEEASDEVLAARTRDGARSAFVVLLGRYQDRIYRIAIRMCHNAADAEEICQDTFALAYRGIGTFHGDSRFATWLYRIAINQVLMRRRAGGRRPQLPRVGLPASSARWPDASGHGEPFVGADDLLHQKMLAQRVHAALSQLDEPHRAALVLRDLEEMSAEEAGSILGVTAQVVRQRSHRARLKMREQLGPLVRGAL